MKMKWLAMFAVLLLSSTNAWANVPEVPAGSAPFILGGILGAIYFLRTFMKK